MPSDKAGYTLRPGLASDVPAAARIYCASFDHDGLLDVLFPGRRQHPRQLETWLRRHFLRRWWTPGWTLSVVVDDAQGEPVGFTWWKRPVDELSWAERWLSPYAWLAPLVHLYISLKTLVRPTLFSDASTNTFGRVFATIEPQLLSTPRRRQAWYLSTIGVMPSLQGRGLGGLLLRHGLRDVDARGAASYMVAATGVEPFYQRYGFVEVARANVGEMKDWEGGAIMFRE